MSDRNAFSKSRYVLWAVSIVILAYVFIFMPTPYVVYKPGSAESVKPFVSVQDGYSEEQGALMLTTVSSSYPNYLQYMLDLIDPNAEVMKKKDLLGEGETTNDYYHKEKFMMRTSQGNAIQTVYRKLGIPYHIQDQGVLLIQTDKETPAGRALQAGDELISLDDVPVHNRDDVFAFMEGKKVGQSVSIAFKRSGKEQTVTVPLVDLNEAAEDGSETESGGDGAQAEPRPGLGVVPVTLQDIEVDQEGKAIQVEINNIIGPSAGLMIALEIYNQLTPEDLTKGYRIAGTGEIDPEGNVSVIGGIGHKVVAANREKADIFFSPADFHYDDDRYPPIANYTDAAKKAKAIGADIQVVPVKTFDDALNYLQSLPPKEAREP